MRQYMHAYSAVCAHTCLWLFYTPTPLSSILFVSSSRLSLYLPIPVISVPGSRCLWFSWLGMGILFWGKHASDKMLKYLWCCNIPCNWYGANAPVLFQAPFETDSPRASGVMQSIDVVGMVPVVQYEDLIQLHEYVKYQTLHGWMCLKQLGDLIIVVDWMLMLWIYFIVVLL